MAKIAALLIYVLTTVVGGPFFVYGANLLFEKITTYHDPADEGWAWKYLRTVLYFFLAGYGTAFVVILHGIGTVQWDIRVLSNTVFSASMVAISLVFSIRVISRIDSDRFRFTEHLQTRLTGFGVAFILSLGFLLLFSAGNWIITNGLNLPTFPDYGSTDNPGTITFLWWTIPFLIGAFSELVLGVLGVRETDPYE
jgi:hypothetical protein